MKYTSSILSAVVKSDVMWCERLAKSKSVTEQSHVTFYLFCLVIILVWSCWLLFYNDVLRVKLIKFPLVKMDKLWFLHGLREGLFLGREQWLPHSDYKTSGMFSSLLKNSTTHKNTFNFDFVHRWRKCKMSDTQGIYAKLSWMYPVLTKTANKHIYQGSMWRYLAILNNDTWQVVFSEFSLIKIPHFQMSNGFYRGYVRDNFLAGGNDFLTVTTRH